MWKLNKYTFALEIEATPHILLEEPLVSKYCTSTYSTIHPPQSISFGGANSYIYGYENLHCTATTATDVMM